ncbi:MAG: hypothetical protein IOD12_13445 [Silvanigrellales bacterium]|jgi:hypothetical protein|nr:hypothetical protein [Silvanigrellales bacterium]
MNVEIRHVDDVFASYPDMIVHPVNCTGVCKDVFSKQLKRTMPDYFRHYTRSVLRHRLTPGAPEMFVHDALFGTRWIVILPVKNHWKEPLVPPLVKQGLTRLAETVKTAEPRSVAMPELEGPPAGWLAEQLRNLLSELPYPLELQLLRLRVDAV